MLMKTLSVALTLVLAGTAGALLYARDAKQDNSSDTLASTETLHDLNLTDEQEAKIAEVRKECRPKVAEAEKDLGSFVKDEVEKVRSVLTPEQREKLQALKELRKEHRGACLAQRLAHLEDLDLTESEMSQIAEIRKEFRPKVVQTLEGLKGVLSDEQRKSREEAVKAGKSRREIRSSLNLTEAQQQKMETVGKELRPILREELEKIRGVLGEEQQQKLAESREERRERIRDRAAAAMANAKDLNLTEEQKTSIAEIRKEFRPKIQEAGNKLRAAVREELGMILDALKG
jgi:Spy/CpxP family protein refolding chaperone